MDTTRHRAQDRRTRIALIVLLALLVLAGLVSGTAGIVHALSRSQDFQWSGERLLLQHIDPWRDYLLGDPEHALVATQVPNYLPVLYLLLVPFGMLAAVPAYLAWAVCNALFAALSAILAARFYGLGNRWTTLGIAAALFASNPARTTISNGQQGLLVLLLWSVALLHTAPLTTRRGLVAGISYFKYSFAPALALYLLLRDGVRRGVRTLLWSFVPSALATVLVWLWITGGRDVHHLAALVTEPLAVTRVGYQPTGDPGQTFMDLLELLLGGGPVGTPRLTTVTLVAAVALTLLLLLLAQRTLRLTHTTTGTASSALANKTHAVAAISEEHRTNGTGWLLALTATLSFVLYKHHPYDEVVFLFPLCHALRHFRFAAAKVTLLLIAYCWYLQPIVDARIVFSLAWCSARILILFALVAAVFRTGQLAAQNTQAAVLAKPEHLAA